MPAPIKPAIAARTFPIEVLVVPAALLVCAPSRPCMNAPFAALAVPKLPIGDFRRRP